jgi:transposase
MSDQDLFGCSADDRNPTSDKSPGEVAGAPRVLRPERGQQQWRASSIEELLPREHRARAIWTLVLRLDLSRFYAGIASRGGRAGRPAIDPTLLVALWLYATAEGVGSARELSRLCGEHDAYRWICGGVGVNHHTLSDFRVAHKDALDDLLTQVLAVMLKQGLVKLHRIAQDGTRVRACAGAKTFRRAGKLQERLKIAAEHVQAVKRQAENPDGGSRNARQQAAAERAAREQQARIERALSELPKAQAAKANRKRKGDVEEARASTTDPEARVMKMGDGGYRPAFNVQLAADTESRVIVGVSVTNTLDHSQLEPMLDQIERRTGDRPKQHLVDGGFARLSALAVAEAAGVTVYAPVMKPRSAERHAPRKGDTPAVKAWRKRMETDEAREIYKQRAATVETVNADLKLWRGLGPFGVRGIEKALAISLWSVLAYNLLRWTCLTPVT